MIPSQFNGDQFDMLKEVVNLAMGQAGSDLAKILNSFVDLTVPDIDIISADKIVEKVLAESVFKKTEQVVMIRQTFSNPIFVNGESIVIFNHDTRKQFAKILGLPDSMDQAEETDFMLELTNIMVGACLNSISDQLFSRHMTFSAPELILEDISLRDAVYRKFKRRQLTWDYSLLSKITFNLKNSSFKSDLLIFMSQEAIPPINESLDRMLAEYE